MFNEVLSQCWNNYLKMSCCHGDTYPCNCYNCLNTGFYNHADEYECDKKMLFYVLNYGASYISEIYHYLTVSQILHSVNGQLNVLSLGCGFCPDYYALSKYIDDNNLRINLNYVGIDNSKSWDETRIHLQNISYIHGDLIDLSRPLSFKGFNLIMMNKVFSTLYVHQKHIPFLENLKNAIENTMEENSLLVFNDVNSWYMGRDTFDGTISRYFNNFRRYYTDNPPFWGNGWLQIPQMNVIYPLNNYGNIFPLYTIAKSVFFEYRK